MLVTAANTKLAQHLSQPGNTWHDTGSSCDPGKSDQWLPLATAVGHACLAEDPDHAERALASELQFPETRKIGSKMLGITLLPLSFSLLLEKEAQNMQGALTVALAKQSDR